MAAEAHNTTELYRLVKVITPKAKRPPASLEMEDGSRLPTPPQVRKRWQRYFVQKLGGHITTFEILLQEILDRQAAVDISVAGLEIAIDCIPAFQEMLQLFGPGKVRKGHGEDVLPYEIYLACPEVLAKYLHTSYVRYD